MYFVQSDFELRRTIAYRDVKLSVSLLRFVRRFQ
jgi:hypothetical protein